MWVWLKGDPKVEREEEARNAKTRHYEWKVNTKIFKGLEVVSTAPIPILEVAEIFKGLGVVSTTLIPILGYLGAAEPPSGQTRVVKPPFLWFFFSSKF